MMDAMEPRRKNIMRKSWLVAVALICCAASAFGQVNMTLTGPPPGPSMGGIYTSPYTASIDNVSTPVICDDFTSESFQGLNWTAGVTGLGALMGTVPSTTVKFDHSIVNPTPAQALQEAAQQQMDYSVIAYLAMELMQVNQSTSAGQTAAGEISYAIWDVFDPAADMSSPIALTGAELAGIGNPLDGYTSGYLYNAEQAVTSLGLTPANFSGRTGYNVTIYTPTPNQNFTQEFLSVSTPEPSAPALLGVYLSSLVGLIFLFRRRVVRSAN
jgi:hypothetical protein